MGREIRRVPLDWEHPRYNRDDAPHPSQVGAYIPLFDADYQSECDKWYQNAKNWKPTEWAKYYHEDAGNPPREENYRPRWPEDAVMGYCVYETVSEGTPVTPVFATPEELIDYLVIHGDFWDQHRGDGGWLREAAESFVKRGFAMSLIVENGQVKAPRDGQ